MQAFLFAAAVAGFGVTAPGDLLHGQDTARACANFQLRTLDPGGTGFRRLGELPPALLEHAVLRSIGGCPVREVRWRGRTVYVPGPTPRAVPADPASHAAPRPAARP